MNSNSLKNWCHLILFLIVLSLFACTHQHTDDSHTHGATEADAHEGEHDHDHENSVHLNMAQYKNADIDTGWFEMKNLSDVIYANGHTKLDPQHQAVVSVPISGTIQTINVIEGNYIKKGQTLATMLSLEINEKQMQKAKLEQQLSESLSNKKYYQQEYDRQVLLSKENISAKKVLEKVTSDLARENGEIVSLQNQIKMLNETIQLFSKNGSSNIPISSPISGHITDIQIQIGETVAAGTIMFSIVDNSKMHLDLLVYEKDLDKVKVGQTVRFMLTNQSNTEIKGKIYNIGKSFANETKSVAIHTDIEGDAKLIPGMFVNALIDIGTNTVRSVPEAAIVMAEGREFIFLWEGENKPITSDENMDTEIGFTRIEVKTGARQLGYVAVTPLEEIHPGDKIVKDGAYYLQSHLLKTSGGGGDHHH